MARYVVAFEQWVKDEKIAFVAFSATVLPGCGRQALDSMLMHGYSTSAHQTKCCLRG